MNLSIVDTNFLVYVCMIFSALSFYVISTLYKSGPLNKLKGKKARLAYTKLNRLVFSGAALLSLVLAVIIYSLASKVTNSSIPSSIALMFLPFTAIASVLLVALFFKKQRRVLAVGALVVALLFSLVLINDYYHYYLTVGQVLGENNAQQYRNDLNSVTINYDVSNNQSTYNNHSIQNSLVNLTHSPTSGTVYKIDIPGTLSHFNARSGYVYVPAIYSSPAQINLPVIVLTAGIPGMPENWLGLGLQNIMNDFAKSHDGIAPLVFVADNTGSIANDTECVDSPRGNVETYLSKDVPNYIKHNFHVIDSPDHWALGGLSLGGMCSIMLTLRHTDVYHYFIDLGGEIGPEVGSKQQTIDTLFGGSEQKWAAHQPSVLLNSKQYRGIGGFFGDGNQDNVQVTQALTQLYSESKKAGIDTVSEIINGAHTFNVWTETYKDALPWISNRIGATQCSPSCL